MSSRAVALLVTLATVSGCGRLGFDRESDTDPAPEPITAMVAQFSTISATFVDVPGGTITIPPSPGRSWLILISAGIWSSTQDEIAVEARYLIDGVERGYGGTQNARPARPGPWQHFYLHAGIDTPATLTVQLRENVALGTSTIEQLHIVAIPMPAAADPLYASGDPIRQVVNAGSETQYNFSLAPASSGDYVFPLLANTSDDPLEADIVTVWRDPDGQPWHEVVQNPRRPWQSHLFVRRATIGPDPVSIRFDADSPGGQIQNVRVFAMRADAFTSFDLAADAIEQQTTAPATTTVNQLAVTGSASRFLYLASSRLQADCNNNIGIADRGNVFTVDGTTESLTHATQNCAYMTTYGTVGLLPSAPSLLTIGYNSGNAEVVVYKESSILLVGLD